VDQSINAEAGPSEVIKTPPQLSKQVIGDDGVDDLLRDIVADPNMNDGDATAYECDISTLIFDMGEDPDMMEDSMAATEGPTISPDRAQDGTANTTSRHFTLSGNESTSSSRSSSRSDTVSPLLWDEPKGSSSSSSSDTAPNLGTVSPLLWDEPSGSGHIAQNQMEVFGYEDDNNDVDLEEMEVQADSAYNTQSQANIHGHCPHATHIHFCCFCDQLVPGTMHPDNGVCGGCNVLNDCNY
jgi:hypothetical protein